MLQNATMAKAHKLPGQKSLCFIYIISKVNHNPQAIKPSVDSFFLLFLYRSLELYLTNRVVFSEGEGNMKIWSVSVMRECRKVEFLKQDSVSLLIGYFNLKVNYLYIYILAAIAALYMSPCQLVRWLVPNKFQRVHLRCSKCFCSFVKDL